MKSMYIYLLAFIMFVAGFALFNQSSVIGSLLMVLGGAMFVVAATSKNSAD